MFGELVLGVSEEVTETLLSKPEPWSLLSLKDREYYQRMSAWLREVERKTAAAERPSLSQRQRLGLDAALLMQAKPTPDVTEFLSRELDLDEDAVADALAAHSETGRPFDALAFRLMLSQKMLDGDAGATTSPSGSSRRKASAPLWLKPCALQEASSP